MKQNPPGNSADNTTTFGYDNAGRLTSAALAQNGTTVSTTTYGWDADSNRTRVSVSGAPDVTFSYNLADQLTGDSAGTSYGYGPDGNLTASGANSYSYDPFGDLTGATSAAGSVSYAPDALGRLASRTAGATTQTFSYDGTSTKLAAQQSSGATTNLVRDPGGMLLAEVPGGGAALRVNPTIHGDIGRLVNPSGGATAWSAVYDPFGTPATTGSAPVNLGFQSMYTDPGTGLVDMGARAYNPSTGTFTAADTVAGAPLSPVTFNRYLYGDGDPADAFDPTGQWSLFGTLSDLWNSFTSFLSDVGTAISQAGQDLSQAASQFAQTVTSAAAQAYDAAKAVAADAVHAVSQVAHNLGPTIGATLASVAVGGLVFLGCEALTGGVGSVGCLTAGGAAGGAVYGALTCPAGTSKLKCASIGALSGAAAGATFGLGSALGLGPVASSALAGAGGNATSQLLTTGHINLTQVGVAALASGLTAGAAKFLGRRLGASDPGFGDPTVPPGETTPAADTATADQTAAPASTSQDTAALTGAAQDTATSTRTSLPAAAEEVVDLYHGTNRSGAESILKNGVDPSYAPRNRDFGNGFYTSEERSLAENWAAKVAGWRGGDPVVLHFRVPANALDSLNSLSFEGDSPALRDFLMSMRTGGSHSYEMVSGPMLSNVQEFLNGADPLLFGDQTVFFSGRAAQLLDDSLVR